MVVALTVALAGCGGGGGTATPAEGDGAASDGNADGSDGSDGSDSSDGSDGNAAPTATAEVGGTAAASTPTATQMESGAGTPTSTPTPNASGPPETDESAGPLLEDVIRSPEEFRYRLETTTEDGNYVQVGRWHGENYYGSIESISGMDQSYEVYRVDGQLYTVMGGQCIDMDVPQVQNPENATDEGSQNWSVRPTGTDTVDGESVYVYEVETGQRIGTMTFYVDTESGYVLRMEFMQTTYEYWDFGNVEPVESPC